MFPHDTYIRTSGEDLRLPLSEEDIIDFGFTISSDSPNIAGIPMIMGYEDGVSTKPVVLETGIAETISQNSPTKISIGSPSCDVIIYRLKIFAKELEAEDMLNSYIVNSKNGSEMVLRDARNDFKDLDVIPANDALTVLKGLSKDLPGVSIILVSAPKFTSGKEKD
jgi:hypothetical protein